MVKAKAKLELKANGRVWIETSEGAFLGYGRIELLEKIKECGSLRQAAAAMKMSYRQAWELIDQMNERAREPLVISQRGGKGGGNAIVTASGEKAIALFHAFNEKFQQFLAQQSLKMNL